MIKKISLLLFMLCFCASSAYAQCYSRAEAEADQGIRIHSELMVIGLNCQSIGARHGLNLYGDYRSFTARHADLFAKYESILMNFYRKNGKSPKAGINTLRTNYANSISKAVAGMRPDIFCAKHAQRMTQAKAMSQQDVRKWASTIYAAHPVSYPVCGE